MLHSEFGSCPFSVCFYSTLLRPLKNSDYQSWMGPPADRCLLWLSLQGRMTTPYKSKCIAVLSRTWARWNMITPEQWGPTLRPIPSPNASPIPFSCLNCCSASCPDLLLRCLASLWSAAWHLWHACCRLGTPALWHLSLFTHLIGVTGSGPESLEKIKTNKKHRYKWGLILSFLPYKHKYLPLRLLGVLKAEAGPISPLNQLN